MTHHYRLRCWSVALTTGILIAFASAGLVACGYNSSTQSSASLTQPQPQLQKCGFVFGFGALELVPRDLGAEQAENCFWQAFQHCRPATLVFNTGARAKFTSTLKHTFTTYNENGACLIADVKQIGSSSNAKISICSGLVWHPRALDVLSCGQEGTVTVLGA